MTITNDVVRMSTTPICNIVLLLRLSGREWTVRSMLTELGPQRTESTVLQYSTKHEPYEARIVLDRVYEGCTGWEQKFPSRPTFGCLAECMKGAWVHTSRLTQIHEEETTTPSRCVSHLTLCTATKAERKTRKLNVFLLINSIACNELTTACHVY